MRRWTAALILAVMLASLPGLVLAQSSLALDRLEIDIWPEYDRPGVLVIYRMTLGAGVSLPAEMTIRIPQVADVPYTVAMQDSDGLLYNLNYSMSMQGEWLLISFTTPRPEVQVEYYDPRLQSSGVEHTFQYSWPGDYTSNVIQVDVMQPAGASEMHISPDMGQPAAGPDGNTYFSRTIEDVQAGTSFNINVAYEKASDELVSTPMPVSPVQPITPKTSGRTTMMDMLGWVLGALGLLLIFGGAFWFWRSGRETPESGRKPPEPARVKESLPAAVVEEDVYCHQCGKRASAGDVFCRACGTRLRR